VRAKPLLPKVCSHPSMQMKLLGFSLVAFTCQLDKLIASNHFQGYPFEWKVLPGCFFEFVFDHFFRGCVFPFSFWLMENQFDLPVVLAASNKIVLSTK
jgi:hypothetical protein